MFERFVFRIVLLALVLALPAVAGCASGAPEPGSSVEEFGAYLDRRVPELLARFDVPGVSLALIEDGRLAWSGAYGYADVARQRPMTVQTSFFRLYSSPGIGDREPIPHPDPGKYPPIDPPGDFDDERTKCWQW